MWNTVPYFEQMCEIINEKKFLDVPFHFSRITGLNYLEDIIANQTRHKAFFAVDDSDNGVTLRMPNGAGYFNRRTVVVYLLQKYDYQNQKERETVLNNLRSIRLKIISKIIHDSKQTSLLYYLNKQRMPYYELSGFFSAGTGGLYTLFTFDEPINLCYNPEDWKSEKSRFNSNFPNVIFQ